MVPVEEGEKNASLAVMGFVLRMQYAFSKNTGFDRRNGILRVIMLVGDQDVLDIRRIVEQVHCEILLAEEKLGHSAHRELHDVAVGMAA